MEAPALRVPRSRGEAVRRELLAREGLRTDLRIRADGEDLLLPLVSAEAAEGLGLPVETVELEEVPQGPASYRDLLDLPAALEAELPTSFDVVGHVCIVKLPDILLPHAHVVGDALLAALKPVRTVALDRGVRGTFRVRDLEVIAGDPDTETVLREHGVTLEVDPARAYISPRLATEHLRIAELVQPGETVVDLFAGIGPFAVLVAKHAHPARVVAVDLNPEAVRYLRRNVARNHVDDVVEVREGDARAVAAELGRVADRIVANLPHGASDFLDAALEVARDGAVLHLHAILPEGSDTVARHVAELDEEARRYGWRLELLDHRVVRAYSPHEDHVALDLRLTRFDEDAD